MQEVRVIPTDLKWTYPVSVIRFLWFYIRTTVWECIFFLKSSSDHRAHCTCIVTETIKYLQYVICRHSYFRKCMFSINHAFSEVAISAHHISSLLIVSVHIRSLVVY